MILIEKERQNEKMNSLYINSENDFKELDKEIDKVIRGEASLEEEEKNNKCNNEELKHKNTKSILNPPKHKRKNNKKNNKNNNQQSKKADEKTKFIQINQKNTNFNNTINSNLVNLYLNKGINNDLRNVNYNSYTFNNNNNKNIDLNSYISYINVNNNNQNLNLCNVNNYSNYNNYINNDYLNNCLNNYVNNICNINNINNIPLNIINELLNNNKQPINQENILINNNINLIPNLVNSNNYINQISLNNNSIFPIDLEMQLLNNSTCHNDINQINNNNQLNINIFQDTNKNINLINNTSQLDFNVFNINNLNINNLIKQKLLSEINQNIQDIQNKNSKNYQCENKKKGFKKTEDINKNIINLKEIFLLNDRRTTVMIKNIKNKYTISTFLTEINEFFKNTYDIFYLPIDYVNKCNLGFAFINFVEPFHIILFYELYRGKKWKKFNSDKRCELLYAKFQGKKELIAHFEKGKVLSMDSEDKRPLILPTPNPLPNINLPSYYFDLFIKIYPNISYEIKDYINNNNNNGKNNKDPLLFPLFSIKGNFYKK